MEDCASSVESLLEQMLQLDPEQRPTAVVCLDYAFFLGGGILVTPWLMEAKQYRFADAAALVAEHNGMTWMDLLGWEIEQGRRRIEELAAHPPELESGDEW